MLRATAALLSLALLGAAPPQASGWAKQRAEWNVPTEPFRLIGNVHYVGTAGVSAFLITDPKGHVLIDGGLEESAPLIARNIRALGFKVEDVKILLNNHAHFDHAAGLAELKRLSNARLLASAGDKPDLEAGRTAGRPDLEPFASVGVDQVIADGEHVRLGAIDLVTRLTPGHTRGCTSWTMRVREGGKPLDMLFACSLSVADQPLAGDAVYPNAARDFRATFAKLRKLKADVFVNFHPVGFGFEAKRAKLKAGDPLAFVDRGELKRQVDAAEKGFEGELAKVTVR